MGKTDFPKYLAEFIATFALIFIGAGAVLVNGITDGSLGLLGIALAHGLVLMVMIYAIGHISGAHVNPVVTLSMWVTKRISFVKGLFYIIAQLLGAVLGALLLFVIFPNAPEALHLGVTQLNNVGVFSGILIEAILTFFLVFTIFGVAVDSRNKGAFFGAAIGLVLTFDILFGGNFTGAAMNPARAFGPALVSGYWGNHYVYWIGPIIGSLVAALVYQFGLMKKD